MNIKANDGRDALHIAAEKTKCHLMKLLLEAGASVKSKNSEGETALIAAVKIYESTEECERVKSMNILIEEGSDVNAVSKENGYTALMYGSHSGYHKCVNLLLKSGADMNARSHSDGSALTLAVAHCRTDCLNMLLLSGADVNVPDGDGNTPLFPVSVWANYSWIDMILKTGADVNATDTEGRTPLMMASSYGFEKSLNVLLQAGADVNKGKDESGQSALIMASFFAHYKCVDMLLNAGADVNATTSDDSNALHVHSYIEFYKFKHLTKCLRRLLRAGIYINKLSKRQRITNALGMLLKTGEIYLRDDPWYADYLDGVMLLYAAGEKLRVRWSDIIPNKLLFKDEKLQLKHICRKAIRKHLLKLDPHQHLFGKIPKLGLPRALNNYLRFNMSLDVNSDNDDSGNHNEDW